MTEIRNSVLAGLAFGILFGVFLAFHFEIKYALIGGSISGLLLGLAIYFFVTSKTVKKQTQIENINGEPSIHSGGANHFRNVEAVGGRLYLLKDRLQFQSHSFNVQNHGQSIYLSEIKQVSFYNTLGLIPNGLAIKKKDGQTEKFVVNGRRIWKEEIEKAKKQVEKPNK